MKRMLIASISLLFAVIYAIPNLALMFGVFLTLYSKYVSLVCCFVFAYNIAKVVESKYKEYRDGNKY